MTIQKVANLNQARTITLQRSLLASANKKQIKQKQKNKNNLANNLRRQKKIQEGQRERE